MNGEDFAYAQWYRTKWAAYPSHLFQLHGPCVMCQNAWRTGHP